MHRSNSQKMTGLTPNSGELSQGSVSSRRQAVFGSQRFVDKPGAAPYTADELIAKLLNQSPSLVERHSSQRHSSASDTILREIALAEASFNPNDLFKEGLDEWHDRSRSMQLLRRSQSVSASRKRPQPGNLRNPSRTSSRLSDLVSRRVDEEEVIPKSSNSLYPPSEFEDQGPGTRHRYDFDFEKPDLVTENEDGTPMDIPKEYAEILNIAPQATLIHLVMMYHQTLLKNGFTEEAKKIADHLIRLENADMEDMALELSGMDLLLRDGLLKYMMSIHPYIPSIPRQVVKFKDVGYTGTVVLDTGYESIGTKAVALVKGPFNKSSTEKMTLLRDLTGYLMPGTLTLMMGTQGCGTGVIHSILAGRANKAGATTVGSITYNGRNVHDIKSQRFVALVGPNDVHFSALTVRETLEFARECTQYYKSQHYGEEMKELLGDALKVGQDPKLETNISIMGLKRVAERPVGSPMMPTITEAERHRVSVAEIIAGTYAVYMFDRLNNGLDDTVTYDLITSLRIFSRIRSSTVAASLIQPPQDIFDLFDRIILLDRSYIVYQGPRQDAVAHFETLGYFKPKHLSVPEFLEEVTTPDGAKYLKPGFPKLNMEGFVAAYKSSDHYRDVCRVVDNPEVVEDLWVQGSKPLGVNFVQSHPNKGQGIVEPLTTLVSSVNEKGGSLAEVSMLHTLKVHPGDEVVAVGGATGPLSYVKIGDKTEASLPQFEQPQESIRLQLERPLPDEGEYDSQFKHNYVQERWPEFLLLLDRELKSTARNKPALLIRAIQVLVLGFYVGFTFFRVHPDDQQLNFNLLRSVFFVSLLDMTLFNVGQLPAIMDERQIYYKQNGGHFYRPSSYVFAKMVGSFPFSLAEATTWSVIVYFLTGLSLRDGGWHFWVFYMLIVLSVLNGAALVRMVAALAPDLVAANGLMGIVVAIFVVFAGFLVPRFQVRKYWIWAYYLDPIQWGVTSLMINEFTSSSYKALCSTVPLASQQAYLPQCIGRPNQTVGHAYLNKGQFYSGRSWIGIAVAVLVGWFILFTSVTWLALSKIRHVPRTIFTPTVEAKLLRRVDTVIDGDVEDQGVTKLCLAAIPVTLSWHELSYDAAIPGVDRTLPLLTYVSGWAEPGELVGLLGATGTGKSVLLNCLAGRGISPGRMGGQILVNGYPRFQPAFVRVTGYCDRLEAYSPYMTVREVVAFSADLQMGKSTSREKRRQFGNEVIELLELQTCANMLVKSLGSNHLTLSEATRVRIGVELARNASILFIDAPTTNLDSRSSLHMAKILRKIADSGRIVIVATTLPSQRLVSYFSSVQILKRGGETVYWGPVGRDGELLKNYFESIPGTPLCPPDISVVTYAVDVIGDGVQDRKALKDYSFEYRVNELALHNHVQLQRLRRAKGSLGPEITDTSFGSSYRTRAWKIITKLQLHYWRNVAYSWGRMFSSVITALLLGSIFWQQKSDTTPGMNTKAGAIFLSALLLSISNAQSVIPQVMSSRANFNREQSARQYHLVLYSLSWTLGEIPYVIVSTLIYSIIFCSMAHIAFGSAHQFFRFWFILFELTLAITFFGMFLASAAVLPQIAGTAVTIFVGFWVATSGLVVPKRKVLPPFKWIFWTNPLQFALTAMTSVAFFCDTSTPECVNNGLNPACLSSAAACPRCRCERLKDTGKFVYTQIAFNRSLHHERVPLYMAAVACFAVFFRVATFLVWKYRAKAS